MAKAPYLGIDLGTTNSAACLFDGEQLTVVRGTTGEVLTPSVVRIDARGNVAVGARALRFLLKDPENTRGEFKRLMGSKRTIAFNASGLAKRPEELAAEVLRSLRVDAESQSGICPDQAVVAVPALFELPQVQATSEAARLAGFARVETIQEPVASALASGWNAEESRGAWLVYDLGGGTFDASLLETQEGLLRIVGHDGDNFLGGRDFDLAIVDFLVERIARSAGLRLDRREASHAPAFAKLKVAAEEAKIELSRGAPETMVLLEDLADGHELLEEPLTSTDLETICAPLIDRTIKVCERLLRAYGTRQLERIVLVGGPTLMPALRARLEQAFGAPFGQGLDPMLLVARGAALFAATAGLSMQARAPTEAVRGPRLWLQFPAMTPDTSPFVVGRAVDEDVRVGAVRFTSMDGSFSSEWTPLEADGTFGTMLSLRRRAQTSFRVEVQTTDGKVVSASPSEITIVHGASIGDPPLARSIGVAKADDSVAVYFERGTPLPCRKTFTHRTAEAISKTATDYALRVPIVQGDFPFAHLCRLVGVIQIPASALSGPLPAGSVIELTLEVDRGGALSARALVPAQKLTFEHVEHFVAPEVPVPDMRVLVAELESRAAALRARAFREGLKAALSTLSDFESAIGSIQRDLDAAEGGDQDAAEKARRALIDCDGMLGDVEAAVSWPELRTRVDDEHVETTYWVERYGTDAEKRALHQSIEATERALRAKNPKEVERRLSAMRTLRITTYYRDPNAWYHALDHASGLIDQASDPAKAHSLVQQARKAEAGGNRGEVERLVRQIWELLPHDPETRALGFDSGVT